MIEAERLYNKIIESTGLVPESNQKREQPSFTTCMPSKSLGIYYLGKELNCCLLLYKRKKHVQ